MFKGIVNMFKGIFKEIVHISVKRDVPMFTNDQMFKRMLKKVFK